MASNSLSPTYYGHIATIHDALLVFEACFNGALELISRRPLRKERGSLIRSGNVFAYSETTGIIRWTDGLPWSSSRSFEGFFVYYQLQELLPSLNEGSAKHSNQTLGLSNNTAQPFNAFHGFKEGGLTKKTMSITVGDICYHLVSYYTVGDVAKSILGTPSNDPRFENTSPRSDLTRNFAPLSNRADPWIEVPGRCNYDTSSSCKTSFQPCQTRPPLRGSYLSSNSHQDLEIRGLKTRNGGPDMESALLAAQAKTGGAQKRTRNSCQNEAITKKVRRERLDAPEDNTRGRQIQMRRQDPAESSSSQAAIDDGSCSSSIADSNAADCIVVGRGEISSMEFRRDAGSDPSHIDQLSLGEPPTVPEQDCRPTPPHTETPPGSPQIEHPIPTTRESLKGFSGNQGTDCKAHEALSIFETDPECGGYQKDVPISRKKVSTKATEPSSSQSSIISYPDLFMSTYHSPGLLQGDNISGAASSTFKRLSITDLLNKSTSSAGHMHPQQSTTPDTTSGSPPSKDTSLGNMQDDVSSGGQSDTKSLMSSGGKPSNITPLPGNSASHDGASRASKPALACGSNVKSVSGLKSDKMRLEGEIVARELAEKGKILIHQSNTPDSWIALSIDPLLSQTPLDFFHLYSQVARAGEVSILSFDLPDVTWQECQTMRVYRGDLDAFNTLRRTVWHYFCMSLIRCPGLAIFRVMVTTPARHVADNTVALLEHLSNETECGRASEPLTRLGRQKPAATNTRELVHRLSSQASISIPQSSCHERAIDGEHQLTRSKDADPPTQKKHLTAELLRARTSGWNLPRKASLDELLASQFVIAPRSHHPPAVLACTAGQDKSVNEASPAVQIAVRIQENEYGQFSRHYDQKVLLSGITVADFFAWFARCAGYDPLGPAKLKFTLKDALPPVHGRVSKGDVEQFEHIKRDIKPYLERAKVLMPELIEFVILVTVPGWAVE
ncbi:uncharacterized protein PAC_02020 [Phialocephala subalpina]|uniref:Gti1/Pac2 family-domain-containing protein n=1 Tax=Phialocephala subalpina TaxID=576137 RepID=A0A1L7WHA1_9HELO|nr:uncharacterized protein PAC_02020 [Phialocephala subalpina]